MHYGPPTRTHDSPHLVGMVDKDEDHHQDGVDSYFTGAQPEEAQTASSAQLAELQGEAKLWMSGTGARSGPLPVFAPDEFLKSRYGFTASPDAQAPPNPNDPAQSARKAYDILGSGDFAPSGYDSWLDSSCMHWVNTLCDTEPPLDLPAAWDISPLRSDTRRLWKLKEGYLIGTKQDPESQCWLLFVKEATTVAQIYRQPGGVMEAAHFLISHGIAFNTAQHQNLRKEPVARVVTGLGYHKHGYQPSAHEYASYVERRDTLLKGPTGRAALKMGGIVWRLAMDVVPIKDVLRGPVGNASSYGQVLDDAERGGKYIDDHLDETATDLICGVYAVETSPGVNQYSLSSLWPRQDTWVCSGMNHGHWTADNEAWFQGRLWEIQGGTAKLRGKTNWKQALTYHRAAHHKIITNTEAHCEAWISREIAGGHTSNAPPRPFT
ncbi:hypothetical protein BD779DRAFT_1470331 [Infundibulicybe gibba]|nr:hypothetical protein BD779DRAFT_1470331 [Infundibulicybe gibba]